MTATYTFDNDLFSDLHKDAHGFRPSQSFYAWLKDANDEQKQAMWDSLIADMERSNAYEREMEQRAIVKFEEVVLTTIASGAKNREAALRWLMDASDCNGDWDYFCYGNGLPYSYFKKVA